MSTPPSDEQIDRRNRRLYGDADVTAAYAGDTALIPAEEVILDRLRSQMSGARVLDLGMGGGRTTPALRALAGESGRYVGIDYAPEMIDAAKRRFPGVDLRVGDARDLSDFEDDAFDLVVFSFNGIDMVSHEGRLLVLAETKRVLRPGGLFVMSAHNRDWVRFGRLPWQGLQRPSFKLLGQVATAIRLTRRRRSFKPLEVHERDYAIVNDSGHDYRLLTYYISAEEQVAQLERAGFDQVEILDPQGEAVTGTDPYSIFLHYVARA